ncbi:hypothetical protein [Telmatospirillum sp. J64-1]|uniref:hypothetical protein n=1 Tax=Telmatospirillum sp. J64-1 TaxID=2502183 RepID=UPI00115CF3AF|nr:hypothetical protein [Telmatospirillum sp. J64-1]
MILLQLYQAYRGGAGGPGHLPFAGGLADQPACVIEAFGIMSAAEVALKEKRNGQDQSQHA